MSWRVCFELIMRREKYYIVYFFSRKQSLSFLYCKNHNKMARKCIICKMPVILIGRLIVSSSLNLSCFLFAIYHSTDTINYCLFNDSYLYTHPCYWKPQCTWYPTIIFMKHDNTNVSQVTFNILRAVIMATAAKI